MEVIIIYIVTILSLSTGLLTKVEVKVTKDRGQRVVMHKIRTEAVSKYKEAYPNDRFRVIRVVKSKTIEVED